MEREGVITFVEGQNVIAQVTFDPTAWFAGVSSEQLSGAVKNADGVIVISSTQNTNFFEWWQMVGILQTTLRSKNSAELKAQPAMNRQCRKAYNMKNL